MSARPGRSQPDRAAGLADVSGGAPAADAGLPGAAPVRRRLGQGEFIALMATLFSTIAFSIDAMLPALPQIAGELTPDAPNRAQLIVTSFVLGMGLGTLVTGPLSDAFGRKPVILGGAVLYVSGAALAWAAQSLELVLAARVVQGLGAAGPRVVALAMIRDLYAGRTMARIMSFVMLIFTLIPAFAPTLGAGIIWLAGWRGIFAAFIVFSAIGAAWLALRQAETLAPERRRPFRATALAAGVREILGHHVVVLSIATQALCFGCLFATLSSTQQIFDITFGRGESFHLWFGAIAIVAGTSSVLNAALVERLGMRVMILSVLVVQILASTVANALAWSGILGPDGMFLLYVLWTIGVFFQAGLTLGNLNALAMEPMGHLAGLTASVAGSIATVLAVGLAVPIGLAFDGTPRPLMAGTLVLVLLATGLMLILRRMDRHGSLLPSR
jgi:DHA1 family bicyclomycin/chloramphenicol resistance-like MFS transporter